MSKAFDTVWHEGLICKLKTKGDSDNLLTLFISIPDKRYHKHQNPHWELIKAGVLQGSILCPSLLLIYINDLPNHLISNDNFLLTIHLFLSPNQHLYFHSVNQ